MTTNTQHTKGPWEVLSYDKRLVVRSVERQFIVCELFDYAMPTDANARLIAAAPALLERLEASNKAIALAAEFIRSLSVEGNTIYANQLMQKHIDNSAAIAKAEGRV